MRAPTSAELLDEYAASLTVDHRHLFETYRFVDMARKVVGVGSVGTRAWVFLLVGREGKDPLVLQAKEAQPSVLEPHLGASEFDEPRRARRPRPTDLAGGERHLPRLAAQRRPRRHGARLLRPPALGLEGLGGPLDDGRGRVCTPTRERAAGRWRARTRAPGTGSRSPPTSARGSTLRPRDRRFSSAYADQNELDHERLAEAVAAGEVAAEPGV